MSRQVIARVLVILGLVLMQLTLGGTASAAPGDLDTSFGTAGTVFVPVGDFSGVGPLEFQKDGRMVAAGRVLIGAEWDFLVVRFLADGQLDPSFGRGGVVITDMGGGFEGASELLLQPNGKIVAVGDTAANIDAGRTLALARFNRNGTLDQSFGIKGKVVVDLPTPDEFCDSAALQLDGGIVCAGLAWATGGADFLVARFDRGGALDPSFGAGGTVTTDFGGHDGAWDMAIQPDSRIVAVGFSEDLALGGSTFALARYRRNGTLDPEFGAGGLVTTDLFDTVDDSAMSVALQPDGRIAVAGASMVSWDWPYQRVFSVARYEVNGALDTTFGRGGTLTTPFPGGYALADAIIVLPDGDLVAGGFAGSLDPYAFDFALARYEPDGTLDGSFGASGTVVTDIRGGDDDQLGDLALQDGKLLAAGAAPDGSTGGYGIALARYLLS